MYPSGGELRAAVLRQLDLRVYAPIPEVVIVRVSGVVDGVTAPMLATRVDNQLARAPHVVVDVGDVSAVDPQALAVLWPLQDKAVAAGTEIHIVRADDDEVRRALRITGVDQVFTVDATAEAVIAEVRAGPARDGRFRGGSRRYRSIGVDVAH
jgi:anti-anti-sigma factor